MKITLFSIIFIVFLSGCSLFEKKGEVIAQVDNEKLTLEELKSNFSDMEWETLSSEKKREYVQQWINMILLAKEAEKLGLDNDKHVTNKISYAKQKVLGNSLISRQLAAQQMSEEDLFNYYRIHQGDFAKPLKNYKVQRIYVTDSSMLNKVKSDIQNGMRFEDAARLYSQEEIGKTGGFMGVVTPEDVDSTYWAAVNKVKLYEVTTLIKDNGFFLLRAYLEEEGSGKYGFDNLKDEIRRRILNERRRQVYDNLLRELKSKANIYIMI